jgi:hypothetical protein
MSAINANIMLFVDVIEIDLHNIGYNQILSFYKSFSNYGDNVYTFTYNGYYTDNSAVSDIANYLYIYNGDSKYATDCQWVVTNTSHNL